MAESEATPSCKCKVAKHVQPLSDKECEEEMKNNPDEASQREDSAHTSRYNDALLVYLEKDLEGYNESDGYPKVCNWSQVNHKLLCCEKRHKNRKMMLEQ